MTARSDEGGGGPFGDASHDHVSAEEAQECDRCDEYTSRVAGFPSRKQRAATENAALQAFNEAVAALPSEPVFPDWGGYATSEVIQHLRRRVDAITELARDALRKA